MVHNILLRSSAPILHHIRMKELKENQVNFNVRDLIELLDDPRNNHFVGARLDESHRNLNNVNYAPVKLKGTYLLSLK